MTDPQPNRDPEALLRSALILREGCTLTPDAVREVVAHLDHLRARADLVSRSFAALDRIRARREQCRRAREVLPYPGDEDARHARARLSARASAYSLAAEELATSLGAPIAMEATG